MASPIAADAADEKFVLSTSRHFVEWLDRVGGSLALTTYQAGKLFLIGLKDKARLAVFERTFERCMGLGVSPNGRSFALATQYQLLRFDNLLPPQGKKDDFDALFVPHIAWITGDLDMHDVTMGADARPVFVNTLFSCLATVSDGYSFRPVWRPSFISRLAAEDRCHLNGLADRERPPALCHAGRGERRGRWLARPPHERRRAHGRGERRDDRRGTVDAAFAAAA